MAWWLWALLAFDILFWGSVGVRHGMRRARKSALRTARVVDVIAAAERDILVYDTVTGTEELWCSYPIERVMSTVESLNELYNPLKLFWQRGDIRPDVALARQREAERARYITRPLERKGVPIYRNNTWPAQIIAYALTHEAALALQEQLMREHGISTTVPGRGAY